MAPTHRSHLPPGTRRRLLLLGGCIGVGSLAALLGVALSGSQVWWLAVPGAVLVVWLWVADPSQCLPSELPASQSPGRKNAP